MCDEPARVTGPDPGSSRSRAAREPSEILDGQASSGTAHGVANYAVTTIRRASRARLRRAEAFVAGGGGGLTVLQDAGGAFRTRTRHRAQRGASACVLSTDARSRRASRD
jgi:hypothetical protein